MNIRDLGRFDAGSVVDVSALAEHGLVNGRRPVKVLAKGKLERGLTVRANAFSESAKKAIEAAGGAAEVIAFEARVARAAGENR